MTVTKIDIAEIASALLEDIDGDTADWELFEVAYDKATVSNQRYQIVFHPQAGRAGIVFCGSGSSGTTSWTDASSAADAFARFRSGEMLN